MTESEALRTLEDLQRLLTNYRHISTELTEANGMAITALEEIQQYRAIGTVSELRELKEKATAKKPIDVRYFAEAGYSIGLCPTCKSGINSEFKYCGDCCQCLDWSEGKE